MKTTAYGANERLSKMPRTTWPSAVLVDLDNTLHDYRSAARHMRSELALYIEKQWCIPRSDVLATYEHLVSAEEDHVFASGHDLRVARMRRLIAGWPQMHGVDPEPLTRFIETTLLDAVRPFEGAIEAYKILRGEIRTMIVTEGYFDTQTGICNRLGLHVDPDAFLATKAHGVRKRDGSAFLLAQERLGTPPDEMVVIGDNWSWDIEAAARTGMWQLWVAPDTADEGGSPPKRYLGRIPAFRGAPAFLSSNWERRDHASKAR